MLASIACPACAMRAPTEDWIIADPQQPSQQSCPTCKERFDIAQLPTVVPLDL